MPEPQAAPSADPIADVLRAAPTSDRVRATAWDAYHEAKDPTDFAARVKDLPLSDDIKASLWDAKKADSGRQQMTFAKVNGKPAPVEDDNSLGTFATHLATQLNPLTAITAAGRTLIPEA